MKAFITTALLSLVMLSPVRAQNEYQRIMAAVEADDHKKALSYVNDLLEVRKYDMKGSLMKVNILLNLQRVEPAFELSNQMVQLFPDSAYAYYIRGNFYERVRDYKSCVSDMEQGLKLPMDDSLRFDVRSFLAGCYLQDRQFLKAEKEYRSLLALDSNNVYTLNNLAGTLMEINRNDEAIGIFRKVIVLDSNFVGGYLNLGYQLGTLGRYRESAEVLELANSKFPDDAYVLNNLGYALIMDNRDKEGLQAINRSLKINPINSYAYRNLAVYHLKKGDKNEACRQIELALRYEFTRLYGDEVELMKQKNCVN